MMLQTILIRAAHVVLAALSVPASVHAQQVSTAQGPTIFDVAGVKLGMSPEEAKASLAKAA